MNSPPKISPKESCGTCRKRFSSVIRGGSTRPANTQVTTVKPAIFPGRMKHALPAQVMNVLTDGESHQQQGQQLGNERGGEYFDSDGFPEATLIDQDLGHHTQAGQRQNPGKGQRPGEIEAQPEVVDDIGGDGQSGNQGEKNGYHRGGEEPAVDSGDEAGNIEFVQADEEKEEEDADAQQDLHFAGGLDDSGNRSQQYSRGRVGHNGVQPEVPEKAFHQFGDDDNQTDGQQGFFNHA